MKLLSHIKNLALVCGMFIAQTGTSTAQITVFAAASLRGALDEVAALSDTDIVLSYAGSGAIARQIANGARADVVILAHSRWMDWLADQGAVLPGSRAEIASNSLVVIGPKGAPSLADPTEISGRLGTDRLAMGQHQAVPAGIYASEWLTETGQWDTLKSRLAEVENVRLALTLVARQETPLGVVYRSDALAEPKVDILYDVPQTAHTAITYPAAAITPNGLDFITLLSSSQALNILHAHGFSTSKVTQ